MSKLNSHCLLLLTLVFSSAHAPTFHFWRNAHRAEPTAAFTGAPGASFASPGRAAAGLPREFAEEYDIKRFQLDELYLPNLDVSLPELFDWSDLDREYLADVGAGSEATSFAPDNSRGAFMRVASVIGGPRFGGGGGGGSGGVGGGDAGGIGSGGGGGSGSTGSIDSSSGADSSQTGKGVPSATSPGDDSSSGGDGNPISDTTPVPTEPDLLQPIGPQPEPVPVPTPGTFMLFALGLAGLHLAGRNKKQKRLAAS